MFFLAIHYYYYVFRRKVRCDKGCSNHLREKFKYTIKDLHLVDLYLKKLKEKNDMYKYEQFVVYEFRTVTIESGS